MGEVTTVLEILAALFAVWIVVMAAAVWWLARRNRVAPDARTGAPLHWLAAPSRAAGAHRRLRRAVAAARAGLDGVGTDSPAHAELVGCVLTLERQAVDLDHRLVVAARCPAATRWSLVGELEPQIRDVERIGGRLAAIAVLAPAQVPPSAAGMDALDARLAALAAARAELDALDGGAPTAGAATTTAAAAGTAAGSATAAATERALPAGTMPGVGLGVPTSPAEAIRRARG